MKPNGRLLRVVAPVIMVPLGALFLASPALSQQAAAPTVDAATLAKYDKNHNGILDPEEVAAMQADQANVSTGNTAAPSGSEQPLQLSPFQVTTTKDTGYFAENTLAGSRLNTNLSDIAASITVVTKQQMEDTASLDINDVFKYEASTEGSSSYAPQIVDRGTIKDTIAGYSFGNDGTTTTNAQSNRIRGLGAPDAAINNYSTDNRIPLDSYNTQSLEISRGPNSLLFGLGTPAGVVNVNLAQAVLNRRSGQVQLRGDQNGSYRASLSFNEPIIKDKLAAYGAFLYDDRQFERKPSRDLYRRQYGALTYKPFSKTVIRGFVENYQNDANRPNTFTPRDWVSPWLASGRPQYDPVTRMVTVPGTGKTYGPYVNSTSSNGYVTPVVANGQIYGNALTGTGALTTLTVTQNGVVYNNPMFVPGLQFDDVARPVRMIDNGAVWATFARQFQFYAPAQTSPITAVPNATTLGWTVGGLSPTTVNGIATTVRTGSDPRFDFVDRYWSSSAALPQPTLTQNSVTYTYGSWQNPGVTNKAVYNWRKYNTLQTNFGKTRAGNYNLELEQQITDNLFFSAGWLRQDIDEVDNYTINQLQGATIAVDTNKSLPDGKPNPYFGLPFIFEGAGGGLDTFYNPETLDNYRAMLAYTFDATKNSNWTKYLGHHRILGLYQEQDTMRTTERWRMNFVGGDPDAVLRYMPNLAVTNTALWSATATMRHYYMASPGAPQATATHSVGFYGNQGWNGIFTSPIEVWNYQNSQYQTENIQEAIAFADNGSFRTQREVKGPQVAIQSYLWQDRLVTTLGWRTDKYRARRTTSGNITDEKGNLVAPAMTPAQLFTNGTSGVENHDAVMSRWNHWDRLSGSTKTLGAAFRPFRGLSFVNRLGGESSVLGEFVNGMTFYYNQSDNFNPPATFQTDYFAKPLPKPTGKGHDGGIGFNLFNNKLVARVNWYTTENTNERTSAAGTLLTRAAYADTTLGLQWASAVLRIRKALAAGRTLNPSTTDPNSLFAQQNWNTDQVWNISSEADQRTLYDLIKLPYLYYNGVPSVGGTQHSKSHGVEAQLTYNPSPNWTMKFSGSADHAKYDHIAPQYDEWIATRMPVWTALSAPDIPDFVDPANSNRRWSLKNFWNGYGYSSNALAENTNGNTSTSGYFATNVLSVVASAKALEGADSPNQRIYHASFLTNYVFTRDEFAGRLHGWSLGGSVRWESRAVIGYYGKVYDPVNQPTLINFSDVTRPIYDKGNWYSDLWLAYSRRIFHDRIGWKIQLNVNNWTESGRLMPTQVNFDGTPWAFRIIDPRQFILTSTFSF